MQMVVFAGVQGSGKSTFFAQHFLHTHVRISLDVVRTRHRERALIRACLDLEQRLVVDNTNPTRAERRLYVELAQQAGFEVVGYYFQSAIDDALRRNAERPPERRVPERGVRGTHARLELPSFEEGFARLCYVRIGPDGGFVVEEWSG